MSEPMAKQEKKHWYYIFSRGPLWRRVLMWLLLAVVLRVITMVINAYMAVSG